MAFQEPNLSQRKAELVRALADCRSDLGKGAEDVASVLDLSALFRNSLRGSQWRWVAGALGAGLVTGIFAATRKRKKRPPVAPARDLRKSLLTSVARGALTSLLQPAVLSLVRKQTERWIRSGRIEG